MSYFYFDFNDTDKQSSKNAIRSLLLQFAVQIDGVFKNLEQLYQKCGNGLQQPTEDAIRSLFLDTMAGTCEKYIVLDALDECTDRDKLLTFLHELIGSKPPNTHLLATSRREKDIEDELRLVVDQSINIQSTVVDADIRIYIEHRMSTDPKLKKWSDPVRNEIVDALMGKARGM